MLSTETKDYIDKACIASDRLYDQGGLLFIYKYGHNRAHSFYNREITTKADQSGAFNSQDLNSLLSFFESALVTPYPDTISPRTREFTLELLDRLDKDFTDTYKFISKIQNDDISRIVELSFIRDNCFHSLELFWSID